MAAVKIVPTKKKESWRQSASDGQRCARPGLPTAQHLGVAHGSREAAGHGLKAMGMVVFATRQWRGGIAARLPHELRAAGLETGAAIPARPSPGPSSRGHTTPN
jgi:hypothetical protein